MRVASSALLLLAARAPRSLQRDGATLAPAGVLLTEQAAGCCEYLELVVKQRIRAYCGGNVATNGGGTSCDWPGLCSLAGVGD